MKLTKDISVDNHFHRLFSVFKPISNSILLISLIVWAICPIIGIIPLLIFSQINVSINARKSKFGFSLFSLTSFSLLLVFITLVVCSSTRRIESDLEEYVKVYLGLGEKPFLEYMKDVNMEPVTFIIPRIIKFIFNDDAMNFVIAQSLTLNFAFMMIAIICMPMYYPTIILLNITSPSYFEQLFLMRQFYSFIFLIPLIYFSGRGVKLILSLLCLFTHTSSLFFIPIALIPFGSFLSTDERGGNINSSKNTKKKILKFIYKMLKRKIVFYGIVLFLCISVSFLLLIGTQYIDLIGSIFPQFLPKIDAYSDSENLLGLSPERLWKALIFDILFLTLLIALMDLKNASKSFYTWSILFIFSALSLVCFYYVQPSFGRLTCLLGGLSGFFYTIILSSDNMSKKLDLKLGLMFAAILIKCSYFIYLIYANSNANLSSLWGGNPFGKNAVDYIDYLIQYKLSY